MITSTNIVDCSTTNFFFDSGGASGDYGNNQNITMTFSPSNPGDFIQLTFTNFDLRELDLISFYDGTSTSANLIGTYTGSSNIGIIGATNPSGAITVVFNSNISSTTDGWEATITCSPTPVQPTVAFMTDSVVFTTCNATFYDQGGASLNYLDDQTQIMTFLPGIPGNFIQLTFSSFVISDFDLISFYDGTSVTDSLIGSYTGNNNIGTIGATNSSGAITVVFTTNNSSNDDGWEATVTCSPTPIFSTVAFMTDGALFKTCGGTFFDQGGASLDYNNNQAQTMTFLPGTPGSFIQLSFTSIDLRNFDFISFYDGVSASAPLIGTYTSNTLIDTIGATNTNGAITVVFTSSLSNTDNGWEANIECSPLEVSSTVSLMTDGALFKTCGGTFYDQGGLNLNYENNENQTMTIAPVYSGAISLTFTNFDLNIFDSLAIYDGPSTSSALLGVFSGSTLPGTFTSSSPNGELTFVFTSDGSSNNDGWIAEIAYLNCNPSILPIDLINFSATLYGEAVKLNWQTVSEINNDYFTVERSIDGIIWEVVSNVNGAGNSTSILSYQSLDLEPYPRISYYRLKQTDFDGVFSYSLIRVVNILTMAPLNTVIYPNPNNGLFNVRLPLSNLKSPLFYSIYNLSGKLIIRKEINKSLNDNNYKINVPEIPKGFYYISIKIGDYSSKTKLIIQ